MSVTVNRSGLFGNKVSIIDTDVFVITVSTANKGLFEGLSTMIWRGKLERKPYVRLLYEDHCIKEDRQKFHNLLVNTLNKCGEEYKMSLKEAVEFAMQNRRGIIKEIKQYQI